MVTFSTGSINTPGAGNLMTVELKKVGLSYYMSMAETLNNRVMIYEIKDPDPSHCHWTCATCDSFENLFNRCLTCRTNWVYDNAAKTCTCDVSANLFILNGPSCDACVSNCGTCSGTTSNCLTCPAGLRKILQAGTPTTCVCPVATTLVAPNPAC